MEASTDSFTPRSRKKNRKRVTVGELRRATKGESTLDKESINALLETIGKVVVGQDANMIEMAKEVVSDHPALSRCPNVKKVIDELFSGPHLKHYAAAQPEDGGDTPGDGNDEDRYDGEGEDGEGEDGEGGNASDAGGGEGEIDWNKVFPTTEDGKFDTSKADKIPHSHVIFCNNQKLLHAGQHKHIKGRTILNSLLRDHMPLFTENRSKTGNCNDPERTRETSDLIDVSV